MKVCGNCANRWTCDKIKDVKYSLMYMWASTGDGCWEDVE